MKKTARVVLAAASLSVVGALGVFAATAPQVEPLAIVTRAGVRHDFKVEIADTPAAQATGLMSRRTMPQDQGMLFEFGLPAQPVSFWMKDTLIPLDIIFVDPRGVIVNIAAGIPQSLTPIPSGGPVKAVLEINGGLAAKFGIQPGDRVEHLFFKK